MKITNIKTQRFEAPLKTPFITSLRRVDTLVDLVVIIESDSGYVGYGEGAPTPIITGETMQSILGAIEYIKPHILHRDIEEFDEIIKTIHRVIVKNSTAKSALEIALYDLKAKSLQLPLYQMLGGSKRDFKTDITISINPLEKMIQDTLNAIDLGYDTLKIKIGSNPKEDIKKIIAINEIVPKTTKLRLDANQGWSAKQTVTLLQALEKREIMAQCIEQPVKYDDIEGLQYIKKRVQTPILADEAIFTLQDAKRVLELDAIDYVNIKLSKTGGISQALALADLSASYGVKCMIGCMLEGVISISAGVHLASAKSDTISMIDLDAVALLKSHSLKSDILFNESEITLGDKIGLGVEF